YVYKASSSAAVSTLSLHDALPIYGESAQVLQVTALSLEIDKNYCDAIPYREKELNLYQNRFKFASELQKKQILTFANVHMAFLRSEEHTSELQSRENLVCRLLLEK